MGHQLELNFWTHLRYESQIAHDTWVYCDSGGISVHTLAIDRKLKTYRVGEVNWVTLQDHTPTILRDLHQDVRDELKPKLDVTTPSYTFNCRRTSSREALKKSYFTLSHDPPPVPDNNSRTTGITSTKVDKPNPSNKGRNAQMRRGGNESNTNVVATGGGGGRTTGRGRGRPKKADQTPIPSQIQQVAPANQTSAAITARNDVAVVQQPPLPQPIIVQVEQPKMSSLNYVGDKGGRGRGGGFISADEANKFQAERRREEEESRKAKGARQIDLFRKSRSPFML